MEGAIHARESSSTVTMNGNDYSNFLSIYHDAEKFDANLKQYE